MAKLVYDKRGKNMKDKTVFQLVGLGIWAICKTIKLEYSLTSYTQVNSRWIKDLNAMLYTIKLIE